MRKEIGMNIQIGIVSCAGCVSMKNPAGDAVYTANAVYVGVVIIHHHIIQRLEERALSIPCNCSIPSQSSPPPDLEPPKRKITQQRNHKR